MRLKQATIQPTEAPKPRGRPRKNTEMPLETLTIAESFVTIKQEPAEKLNLFEETSYCRCCFKLLSILEVQFSEDVTTLQAFQEIVQLNIEPSPIAASFCESCYNEIISFNQFKTLAILKQQKFIEVTANGGDINEVWEIKLSSDPLIKDEEIPETNVIKEETLKVEMTEECDEELLQEFQKPKPPSSKKKPKTVHPKCLQCNERPRSMRRHLLQSHSQNLKCYLCKFQSGDSDTMLKHIEKKHKMDEQLEPQVCPICGKLIKQNIQKHIEAIHKKIRNYFCDLCGFSGYQRQYLINHMRQSHLVKQISCELCEFVTITKGRLNLHMKNKHMSRDAALTCLHCNRVFCTKAYLQEHIERKHQNKKEATCSICERDFFSQAEYE